MYHHASHGENVARPSGRIGWIGGGGGGPAASNIHCDFQKHEWSTAGEGTTEFRFDS